MKILQVNKFYYPRGGADKYFIDLSRELEKDGHEAAIFSMQHPKNLKTPFSEYFVSRFSFNEGSKLNFLKAPGRIIYSLEAKRKFKKLVNDFKPDIIHIHNIYHQISPSILDVAKEYKIPVVMHLHDYKLICPNYQLFVAGRTCEACNPKKYCHCIKNKCFKKSLAKSILAALEMYIHHSVLKIYEKNITTFIAPSGFMKEKLISFSWPENKIKIITNPFSPELSRNDNDKNIIEEDYLLYFGRLSKEKGLETLISAAAITNSKIKLAGVGPEKEKLEKISHDLKVNTEFLGFTSGEELKLTILKAKAIIIPSIWYENMPLSLLEALNLGKLVIASNIGGIPEIIKDGQNGFLFKAGDKNDLALKIKNLDNINTLNIKDSALKSVESFNPRENARLVQNIYQEILKK
ncbi:MAG: glycosyltransferase [Patescibacteria group bacterium]